MKEFKLNVENLPKEVKEAIKKKAIHLGYVWQFTHKPHYLYFRNSGNVGWSNDRFYFTNSEHFEEITLPEFFALKKEDDFKPGWYSDESIIRPHDDADYFVEFDKNKNPLWSIGGMMWSEDVFNNLSVNWQPLSKQEVLEAFKREVEKREYKEGARVKCLYDRSIQCLTNIDIELTKCYDKGAYELWATPDCLLWDQGKWAEIVEEEKLGISESLKRILNHLNASVNSAKEHEREIKRPGEILKVDSEEKICATRKNNRVFDLSITTPYSAKEIHELMAITGLNIDQVENILKTIMFSGIKLDSVKDAILRGDLYFENKQETSNKDLMQKMEEIHKEIKSFKK